MSNYFIEIGSKSIQKQGQEVCGDVFLSRKLQKEGRTIAVLSDGLGSGIKANVLATMTVSMSLNFTIANQPVERTSRSIYDTLPIDKERKINYSTFTIVDIEFDGETTILENGNPRALIFRNNETLNINPKSTNDDVSSSRFCAQKGDRIIFFSDGVSQSGMGRADMPFGWDREDIINFITYLLVKDNNISAQQLADLIVNRSLLNDSLYAKDDITCSVLYFRDPRSLIVCTGPPYKKEKDALMSKMVSSFKGTKVICGGTTAQIISRELNKEIETDIFSGDGELPPVSVIEGIDLVTEGILTLGKVSDLLDNNLNEVKKKNPAHKIINLFLKNDKIVFLVGTRINEAHQDPSLPVELEIRRNVVKKIAGLLEDKYMKEVHIQYI